MPPTHTLHHPTDRTRAIRPARPARPARAAARPITRAAADALPPGLPGAQRALARSAAAALARAGLVASVGEYGGQATADAHLALGSLVVVPMAALWDLDPELAAEDGADPAVWHVLAREGGGRLLEPDLSADACPSVLLAVRARLSPLVAPALVRAALADPQVARLVLGTAGSR